MPKFECPHCSQRINAPDESAETGSTCPACGGSISVPAPEPAEPSADKPVIVVIPKERPLPSTAAQVKLPPPPPKSKKPPPVPSRPKTPPPHKKIPPPPPVSGVSKPSPAPPSSGKPTGGKRALGAVLAILLLLALCGGGFYFWQQNEKNKERLEKQRIAETEKAEKLEAERERELEAERIRTQKAQAAASVMLAKAEVYCETSKLDEASELLINVQRYELTPEMKSQVGELRERIERDRRRLVQQKIEEAEIAKREAERAGTRAREEQERAARERQDMLTRQKADTARLREQEKLNSGASLERELVLFINEYYRKLTSNNTSEVGSLYDDYVDFEYIKGRKASRREVVQSFSANIKRWPNRAYTPLGKTSYELINNSHTSVRLHFGYEYNYTNYSGKKAKGKAYDTVSIQKKYGRWRIVKWEQGVKRTRNDLRGL